MFCFLLIVWASFVLFWKQEGIKTSLLSVIKLVLCQLTFFFPILIPGVRTHGCLT
jgi:hypothetical protein